MKNSLIILFCSLILTACFGSQTKNPSSTTSQKGLISESDFYGAASAVNTVTGIRVTWSPSKVSASAYRIYKVSGASLNLLASLSSNVNSFIDGSVYNGTVYSYIVRAVDTAGIEEQNNTKVSALSWGGISSLNATGRTSITVIFNQPTPAADEIRIYLQGDASEAPIVTTISGSTLSTTLTGLREGFTYKVTAQAYVGSLKKEDGNSIQLFVTTLTSGYDVDPISGDAPAWMGVTNVRAFGPSPGAVSHPSVQYQSPQAAQVELSFKSFNGFGPLTKYVVTRANQAFPLDVSVTTRCTNSMMTSCRVVCLPNTSTSEISGSEILNCRDLNVAPAPARYKYTISLLRTSGTISWIEPLSTENEDKFSIIVPIPPKDMVLIHRNAVNYEMCSQQMNITPDPLNNNRCANRGVAATTYNAGPGKPPLSLPTGFYDFGYSLFVDRFEMSCKWTPAAEGGRCGLNGDIGDCVGGISVYGDPPPNTIGVDGNVYLGLWGTASSGNATGYNACFVKYNGAWKASKDVLSALPNGPDVLPTMYTSDPSTNGGKVAVTAEGMNSYQGWSVCQGHVDPYYGPKRLPRMREYRAYSAFPTVPGDFYYMNYARALSLASVNSTTVFNSTNGYRCPTNISTTTYPAVASINSMNAALNSTTSEFFGYIDAGIIYGRTFRMSSATTQDCQGRYGINNVHNVTSSWVSDNMMVNSTTKVFTGISSYLDSGNTDLQQDLAGTALGFSLSYTTATANGTSNYFFNLSNSAVITYMSLALGLPVLTATPSSGYTAGTAFNENYNNILQTPFPSGTNIARGLKLAGRWTTYVVGAALTGSDAAALRCVVPTE